MILTCLLGLFIELVEINTSHKTNICSKSAIENLEKRVKYVQNYQQGLAVSCGFGNIY